MSKQKHSLPYKQVESTSPYTFVQEGEERTFLIRKANLELLVNLRGTTVTVQVSAYNQADQTLAASIARVQQQLLQNDLREYAGHHPYAYLLALYNDQGWMIRETENESSEKSSNGTDAKQAKK